MKMVIYDFTGRLIEAREFTLRQGANVFSVNTGKWQPGTYMVQLLTQSQTINKKLLIQADAVLK